MRASEHRQASALVFVLVLVVAMSTAVLTAIAFAAHVASVEDRSETLASATLAMEGATSDIRSELAAGTIAGPGTVAIPVGSMNVTTVITDNAASVPNTYGLASSVVIGGKPYSKTDVIGYSTGHGLFCQCFDSTNGYFGNLLFQRVDPNVNFNWGVGSPDPVVPNVNFSARWNGTITPVATGNYTFTTTSDDGVRLWVNGQLVISDWNDHAATNDTSASVSLAAGQPYDIRLDFYQHLVYSVMQLQWTPPASVLQAIPPSVLSPNPLRLANYTYADLSSSYNQDGYSFSTNKGDGNLGGSARTFPAELVPSTIRYNGVRFTLGPTADGSENVVKCAGQTLTMPSGSYTSVRVLCVSTNGTQSDRFTLDYSDGSSSSSSPAIYDWRAALTLNESVAMTFPKTYTSASVDWTMAHMQVITLAANSSKTLTGLDIPNRASTVVLAVTCVS
ncbi:MAG: PA14 domain-containing protein [Fimbriimonadales bacterium]